MTDENEERAGGDEAADHEDGNGEADEALEADAAEKEEEGLPEDERIEAEATSQRRLDVAANPDEGGAAPYPPKPA
jgi:hypothetical protein